MLSEQMRREALSRCIVWFYDGNVRTFYSLDKTHEKAQPNHSLGIRRLERMLMQTFKGQWETAIIYENKQDGPEIARYKRGVRV